MIKFFKTEALLALFCALFFAVSCSESATEVQEESTELLNSFSLSLSGDEVDDLSLNISVINNKVTNYVVGVITEAVYTDSYSNDLTTAATKYISAISSSVDFSVADNKYLFSGSQTIDIASNWTLKSGITYVILVVGVDELGEQITKISSTSVTTVRSDISSLEYVDILFINEIAPSTGALEIYSAAEEAIDLEGFSLVNQDETTLYTFTSTQIEPKGYVVAQGLELEIMGGTISLYDSDGNAVELDVEYGELAAGTSYGRQSDGSDSWTIFEEGYVTIGSANGEGGTMSPTDI